MAVSGRPITRYLVRNTKYDDAPIDPQMMFPFARLIGKVGETPHSVRFVRGKYLLVTTSSH